MKVVHEKYRITLDHQQMQQLELYENMNICYQE